MFIPISLAKLDTVEEVKDIISAPGELKACLNARQAHVSLTNPALKKDRT